MPSASFDQLRLWWCPRIGTGPAAHSGAAQPIAAVRWGTGGMCQTSARVSRVTRLDILPLAESVRWRGKLLPRYGWYMLSGALCDIGQFVLYKLLWNTFGLPTLAWTAAYVLSIAMRQETHKVFVFGHYEGAWWKNLWRFYCVYFLTVATSMPVNLLLVRAMAFLPREVTALGIAENTYVRAGAHARPCERALRTRKPAVQQWPRRGRATACAHWGEGAVA